jgi:hypothetical protein
MELLMRAQEFVREGLPPFLTNVFRAGEPAVANAVNAVKNIIVSPTANSSMLTGRVPAKPEDITHAYRNMSPSELEHAQTTGYFLTNPSPGRTPGWSPDQKFWSSGDAEGHFGRDWKNASDNAKVRVPIDKVPGDTAVNAGHAEVLNRETGEWAPVVTKP